MSKIIRTDIAEFGHHTIKAGEAFEWEGKTYQAVKVSDVTCGGCFFKKDGRACPNVSCSGLAFKKYTQRNSNANSAYIAFREESGYVHMGTVTSFSALMGYIMRSDVKACVGIYFNRGSKYFRRQMTQTIKAGFNSNPTVHEDYDTLLEERLRVMSLTGGKR
tara:strand:+ start:119 stop:604 length:486 start_codon:yes stop_codon:yes gene_type:complete